MSLQAIAGVAYDRRYPDSPSNVARSRIEAEAEVPQQTPQSVPQAAAKQLNGALEALKRYIPTEFLALYMPFVAIAKDQFKSDAAGQWPCWIYVGFLVATPFAVFLIYVAKAAETGKQGAWKTLPYFEAALATVAFAVWGACVPSMFPGNQWWIAMLAMASAFVLPLVDTAFSPLFRT